MNVEMWGIIMSEGKHGSVLYPNHTYKALRIVGEQYNYLYTYGAAVSTNCTT